MKICILIPTYNRNKELFRLLSQIRTLKSTYGGSNQYMIFVADSDQSNLQKTAIEAYCDQIIVNPGKGFDENMMNYYLNYAKDFDWTLSISDDDLFSVAFIHPFEIIDTAARSKAEIVIFNHIEFNVSDNGMVNILNRHYLDQKLSVDSNFLAAYFLKLLPRHVGLLYSRSSVIRSIQHLSPFSGTLHLYSVPLILCSLKGAVTFFDYPLCYFNIDPKSDGAWENKFLVFDGLLKFLIALRGVIKHENYLIAKEGFRVNFFGDNSNFRSELVGNGLQLPSEDEILKLL